VKMVMNLLEFSLTAECYQLLKKGACSTDWVHVASGAVIDFVSIGYINFKAN